MFAEINIYAWRDAIFLNLRYNLISSSTNSSFHSAEHRPEDLNAVRFCHDGLGGQLLENAIHEQLGDSKKEFLKWFKAELPVKILTIW